MGLDNKPGSGGRLGYMFSNKIGIEVDVFGYTTQPSSTAYTGVYVSENPDARPPHVQRPARRRPRLHLWSGVRDTTVGQGRTSYFLERPTITDGGPGGLIGLRFGAGGPVSVRLDLTADYIHPATSAREYRPRVASEPIAPTGAWTRC